MICIILLVLLVWMYKFVPFLNVIVVQIYPGERNTFYLHTHTGFSQLTGQSTYVRKVTKRFSGKKKVHVGMLPSKTSQKRWE